MYYKILRSDLTHNGFVYKEGLNVLDGPFNSDPCCKPGGLFFVEDLYIFCWLTMYTSDINDIYIADVKLSDYS